MKLSEAIAVFDKSAERTTPNKQTEAWAVIRAELVALSDELATTRAYMDATFDGNAVYAALTKDATRRTGPENVSDTLDALARVATPSAGGE